MKWFNRFLIVALFPVYVPLALLGNWMCVAGARKKERSFEAKQRMEEEK
jgi:hypothetical protein